MEQQEPATTFANLASLVYAKADYADVHQAIVDAAPHLVPGCDHASLMVLRNGRFQTMTASDDVAAYVDQVEREVGDGPCVDAITDEGFQLDDDIARRSQWPRLAERLLAETPVRGMLGHRLVVEDTKAGALNLFADEPGALTQESADQSTILASFASVALAALAHDERAETLQHGLTSNREIGKAIGLLMTAHRISSEEAFELLRKASTDMNIKLVRVAREVVEHHDSRPRKEQR
jgi:transcriptional regulator with GAF, ATPase, and Fis domain